MSKILLVDVETEREEILLGTCDLCYHSEFLEVSSYEFEYEDGEHEVISSVYIDEWGSYLFELPDFHVTRFAGWLEKQEFHRDYRIRTTHELDKLVLNYELNTRGDE